KGSVLVRRHPAEVLDRHLDPLLEDDRIVDMPAVGARVPAHDAPLVEVGRAGIRGARALQAPGREEVVLRAGPPDRGALLAVDVDLLVPLAEPHWATGAHGED